MVHLLPLLSTAILIGAAILTTPATSNNVAPAPIDAISAAAKQSEELRHRLQTHVANQVNKLIQDNKIKDNKQLREEYGDDEVGGGGGGKPQKIELKIDLPPELAELVQKSGGIAVSGASNKGSLKFKRTADGKVGELYFDDSVAEHGNIEIHGNVKISESSKNVVTTAAEDGSGKAYPSRPSLQEKQKDDGAVSNDKGSNDNNQEGETEKRRPCPLGDYSDDGFYLIRLGTLRGCQRCPDGTTTLREGSAGIESCRIVTEEDLLGMFYDLVNGDVWDDEYSKHWKSDRNICEWGGITCNEKTGEVIGLAFPINGMKD